MKRNYIGLANSFHDSAMAIVNDLGKVVFAEGTERYLQTKRAMNVMPDVLVRTSQLLEEHCDPDAQIVAATTWSDDTREQLGQLLQTHATATLKQLNPAVPPAILRSSANFEFFLACQSRAVTDAAGTLQYELSQIRARAATPLVKRAYEHHLAHAAAACFTSPFEDAVCAILDGFGEGRSYAYYAYRNGKLTELESREKSSVASLGGFFSEVCDACGFGYLTGEEWKVMGLAAYGHFDPGVYSILRDMIRVNGVHLEVSALRTWQLRQQLDAIRRKCGEPAISAANLAYAGQQVFTEVLFELLGNLHALCPRDNLVLGGGCALNSSANGRILESTPFKNLHVFSAPADDGNAVGAALLAYQEDHPGFAPAAAFQSPYIGSTMSVESLNNVRRFSGLPKMTECGAQAPERAAQLLAQGRIVGWIQGRAEFGPRALGNRSILADPRSPQIKDTINARVKFREEFRPFAPAILDQFGPRYFENYQVSPYMERTLRFRPEVLARVPGVVHEDGTGRLQTVRKEWNEPYYRLVKRFHELTDIPLIINTSFNVMGKPIAHSVEDVLAVFFTSGLDAVFIDGLMLEK